MKVSIIGPGLIGGSFALALKKRLEEVTIYGWDQNPDHLKAASELGIIDEAVNSLQKAIEASDWIILAIPVNAIEAILPQCLDNLQPDQVLVDFGSTKESICHVADQHHKRAQFIAAHPIAGTEYSGPQAAFPGLYEDKVMIVCDEEKSAPEAIDSFRKLCKMIGMSTTYLKATEHDLHLAYVSHLSHVIAFGLSNTVLKQEESDAHILDLAGSGFASTVRLAKSSPDMWTPIFLKNKGAILDSLENYLEQLTQFKSLLENESTDEIRAFLEKGRAIRKILK
ncbi:MAG: prephenate dehydrogenase [Roseivirga sp.]